MPRLSPPTRSPSAKAERMCEDRELDLAVAQVAAHASAPVTTSIARAWRSTSTRRLRAGATRLACSRVAKPCGSPSAWPTKTENSKRQACSAARIVRSIS